MINSGHIPGKKSLLVYFIRIIDSRLETYLYKTSHVYQVLAHIIDIASLSCHIFYLTH